ncbi:hypothetical protein OG218_01430 [Kineococcus sp. NBC_00420]|uniref:hypothetical protein n=1 Tax=Kineococcus sp. NBC_00420 TaxID=2903564 RepID=UPI002E1E8693
MAGLDRTSPPRLMTATANFHNLTDAWHQRVLTSFQRCRAGVSDFSWINVGDSIATGRIGIETADDHYTALASDELARMVKLRAELFCGSPDTCVKPSPASPPR